MIPHTYPSILDGNRTKMVVYSLPSVDGLVAWVDYIPVKAPPDANDLTVANTFAANGFILSSALESIDGKQAWLDYIPVFVSESGTIPWSTDAGGYIPLDAVSAIVEFSPSSLFANSEVGVWYDPSDVNVNWRRNLLTYTEEFDNGVWAKTNLTVTANATTAPDGTSTADKLVENTGTSIHTTAQSSSFVQGQAYVFTIYAKSSERILQFVAPTTLSVSGFANFDLITGSLGSFGGSGGLTSSIVDVGDGWYRCVVSVNSSNNTGTGSPTLNIVQSSTSIRLAASTGDGTSGIYIWGAQLEAGETLTTYQRIVTPEITYIADVQPQPILYQDSAGSTPVTAVEQPVGLMLDKSQGLVLSSELVTNGTFDTDTDWTKGTGWSIADGVATANTTLGAEVIRSDSSWAGENNKFYLVTATITMLATPNSLARVRINIGGTGQNVLISSEGQLQAGNTYQIYGIGNPTSVNAGQFRIAVGSNLNYPMNYTIDNISVKELFGNHALQTTSASRPTLSARYNLLTYTEQFDNAIWSKSNVTITANATTAPDGTSTADKITQSVVSALTVQIAQLKTILASVNYTYSIYLKQNDCEDYIKILLGSSNQNSGFGLSIDPSDMTVQYANAAGTGYNYVSHSVESVGNGWYCVSITGSSSTTTSIAAYIAFNDNATGSHSSDRITNGGTGSFYIWGADLRVSNDGVDLPVYQRVAADTEYDTVGFPTYLAFDGVDDSMATNSIDFTGTDKMTVWSGLTIQNISGFKGFFQLDGTTSGSFFSYANNAALEFKTVGDLATSAIITNCFLPSSSVIINATMNLNGLSGADCLSVRKNGSALAQSTVVAGGGNYQNAALTLGLATGVRLNGRLYSLIVRGAESTATEITDTEDWVNNVTKAY